jgi:hypothetical protein
MRNRAADRLRRATPRIRVERLARSMHDGGAAYIAQWIGEHPKWTAVRWHCDYPGKNKDT